MEVEVLPCEEEVRQRGAWCEHCGERASPVFADAISRAEGGEGIVGVGQRCGGIDIGAKGCKSQQSLHGK